MGSNEGALLKPSRASNPLKSDWQRHVLACSGYLELGMFDDAALALEEIEPKDKTRTEVLGARVVLYIAAKKWDMAAAVARHLVKAEPKNEAWWINLAYSVRRIESIEKAEAILLSCTSHTSHCCHDRLQPRLPRGRRPPDTDLKPLWDWIGGLE
jgi:lipopolysaccharide biosynthesis regulator YciM